MFQSPTEEGGKPFISVLHIKSDARLTIDVRGMSEAASQLIAPLKRFGVDTLTTSSDLAVTDVLALQDHERVACVLPNATRALYLIGAAAAGAAGGAPATLRGLVSVQGHSIVCATRVERLALSYACDVAGLDPATVNIVASSKDPSSVVAVWATPAEARAYADSRGAGGGLRLISYDPDLDPRRRAAVAPLLQVVNIDVDTILPKRAGTQKEVATLLAAPLALAGAPEIEQQDSRAKLLVAVTNAVLASDVDTVALNNYYGTRFPNRFVLYGVCADALKQRNADVLRVRGTTEVDYTAVGRPEKSVLEQFSGEGDDDEAALSIETTRDVVGSYALKSSDHMQRSMRMQSIRLEDVPLRQGDRVALRAQTHADQNGDYFVTAVEPGRGALLVAPVVSTTPRPRIDRSINDGLFRVWVSSYTSGVHLQAGDRVVLQAMDGAHGSVLRINPKNDDALVLIDAQVDKATLDKFHPLSLCSTDPLVPVKELCLAKGGTWDRPCENDRDCPFFQMAPSSHTRGGCLQSGFCEMPIGVPIVGYRHYNVALSRPVCRGSANPPARDASGAPDYSRCDFMF